MQNTINYNLKKPDYTDFADIQDINDNMDKIDEELAAPTGDSADSTATFTCSDVADGDAAAWTNVPALTSGETHKSIFAKMSQMFKNLRYLYKLLGTTDISSIGNGTVTGGLSSLNSSLSFCWFGDTQKRIVKLQTVVIGTLSASATYEHTIYISDLSLTSSPYVFTQVELYANPGIIESVVLNSTTTQVLIRIKNNHTATISNIKVHVLIVGAF